MRTTLTIDDDVALQLERLQRERRMSLKQLVNDALRQGLNQLEAKPKPRKRFRMRTFDGGKPLLPLDNIAETIAMIEGEDYK